MSKVDQKEQIFKKFFEIVIFEGWSEETLKTAAKEAGFDPILGLHYFPNGPTDIMDTLAIKMDEELARTTSPKEIAKMRVHEKISHLTKKRLLLYTPYRDALESYGVHLVFPRNAATSLKAIARTVDLIWFMVGDTSTDHNYYSKRGLLGVVYVSTALYWMNDKSESFGESWSFLDRRIENVLKFGKAISQFNPIDAAKNKADLVGNILKSPKRFWDRLNSRDI